MTTMTEREALELYNDMLDDVYEPFMGTYTPSQVLEAVDPIAYQLGFQDYCDSEEIEV